MTAIWITLLLLVALCGLVLTLFSLPGNWLILAAAAVYAFFHPSDTAAGISWILILVLALLAVLGEIVEAAAGALGAAQAGASRRSTLLALAGSMIGAVAGIFVGLPIPLVGPVLAALLFAAVGAMLGAVLGEQWKGRALEDSWEVGKGAFWGRLFGTLGKVMVGFVMVVTLVAALIF